MGNRNSTLTEISNTTRNITFFFLLLTSCFLLSVYPASAGEDINITADNLEFLSSSNSYIAKGSVKIVFEDATLRADEMLLNSETSYAEAAGNVVYEDSDAVVTADRIEIYLKSKTGTLYNGYIFYKERNYHLHAGNIKKTGDGSFSLDSATVTTCDSDPPEWHISGKDIKAVRHKNISGWSGKFHINNVPVLYTPYFMVPLINERQTGFLFPSYGYSSIRGHSYKQGFFWAIKENQDATLYLDYYSEKGLAQGIDYRYILTPDVNGEFWMYHVRDDDPSRDLYELKTYHNLVLPYNIAGYVKLHAVNEYDYYDVMESTSSGRFGLRSWSKNPFGFASEERLQKYLESNIHISRPFEGGRVYILGQSRQSLEGKSNTIPQTLPETAFVLNTASAGPFSFNMTAKGTNFWTKDGQEGRRLDIFPNIYYSAGRLVNVTQRIGLRETAYFLKSPTLNKNRLLADFSTSLNTKFYRKYETLIHIIEPSLEYAYIPPFNDDDIPFFDSIDTIEHISNINYALTNRISGLYSGNAEMRFRLSQSYSLIKDDSPFSPLLAEATFTTENIDFSINASYDVHTRLVSETISSLKLRNKIGYAGIGKNFRRSSSLDQVTLEAGLSRPVSFFKYDLPINFDGLLWYDLNGGGVQELNLKSTYLRQCWGLSVNYIKRPEEYQVVFTVELTGIGSLKLGSI